MAILESRECDMCGYEVLHADGNYLHYSGVKLLVLCNACSHNYDLQIKDRRNGEIVMVADYQSSA